MPSPDKPCAGRLWPLVAGCCALAAACSSGSSVRATPSTTPSPSPDATPCVTTGTGATSGGGDASPAGDIPDSQAFVAFSPTSGAYTVEVPEGWTRTSSLNREHWQDKLISVEVRVTDRASAPTTTSVRAEEITSIEHAFRCVKVGAISTVTRKSGAAIRVTYQADSAPAPVTGKVVRDDVERYEFWHADKLATVTLAAPAGSDNVDVWRRITDSFTWR